MWILILTLAGYGSQSSPAIESISGFGSKEACLAAGNAWTQKIHSDAYNRNTPSALCVPTK